MTTIPNNLQNRYFYYKVIHKLWINKSTKSWMLFKLLSQISRKTHNGANLQKKSIQKSKMTSLKLLDKCQGRDSNPRLLNFKATLFLLPYKFWTRSIGGYFYFYWYISILALQVTLQVLVFIMKTTWECKHSDMKDKNQWKGHFYNCSKEIFSLEIWFSGAANKLLLYIKFCLESFYKS